MRWWRNPDVQDAALVAAFVLLATYEYSHPGDDGHRAGPFALNGPLTLLELLPLAWRRRNPVAAFVAGYAVVIVPSLVAAHTLFAYSGMFPLAIYLYSVARHRDLPVSRWALLGPPIAVGSYALHVPQTRDVSDAIFATIVFGIAFLTGVTMRRLAGQRAALADALARLDEEHRERERLALLAERTRLARDLHDVVAHAVALMLIQAGSARRALEVDPDQAREALYAVERVGREATGDLRKLLGLLRVDDSADLVPAPGLGDLDRLLAEARGAGLEVTLETVGEQPELPSSLDLSAYRVVQEALTNVLKHAGRTRVRVRLDFRSDPMRITVRDDGPRGPRETATPTGHGLQGMRERVSLFGGSVDAHPSDTGFAVDVALPRAAP